MKEKFTPEEWEMLKALPFAAFGVVALADGKVNHKEAAEFNKRLQSAAGYKDPLHKELALDILVSDIPVLIARAAKVDLNSIKGFLGEKLTQDEYQRFLGSILIDVLAVARASGGFLGRGAVSDEESRALAVFGARFGIDLAAVKRLFGG